MPNGNHNFNEKELPMLERFFGQLSNELKSFAEEHNLLINKYWHQFHSWRFSFKHPKGGIGALELFKETDLLAMIYSYWWIDDYDNFTRLGRTCKTDLFRAKNENIKIILEENFYEILSWQLDEWTDVAREFESSWKRYTKEEFYKLNDKYPVPKF